MFRSLKILDSVSEFYRLYPKKESHSNPSKKPKLDSKSPPIFISFKDISDLRVFTKKLADLKKNKKYEKLVMEFSCPPSLKLEYESASEEAYKLRQQKNLLTRCRITKNGIKLLARSKDETKFTEATFPRNH